MLAARARGGRRSGALVASRCAANKRALSATGQARLLEQSELVRWKLGPRNHVRERCGREPVTYLAARRGAEALKSGDDDDPHDFFRSLDASTRGLWSVYDSSGLPVHASVWVGQIGSARLP